MSEKKEKAWTEDNNFADCKCPKTRAVLQRSAARRRKEKGEQENLFGWKTIRKETTKVNQALQELRAAQALVDRLSHELFLGRTPIPFEPYVAAQTAVLFADNLTNLSKLLFFTIAWHATMSKEKAAFPTQERLAELLGRRKRQIQNALKELVDAGYVRVSLRRVGHHKHGEIFVNQYELNLTDPRTTKREKERGRKK